MSVTKRSWVGANGKKQSTWAVTFYADDENGFRQRHRKAGFDTRREAEEWERHEFERLKQARLTPAEKALELTVGELAHEWLNAIQKGHSERPPVEPLTYKKYEITVRVHIKPRIGDKPLTRFDQQAAQAFRKRLLEEVSRTSAQTILLHLRTMLNYGVEQGYLLFNPAAAVRVVGDTRTKKTLKMPTRAEMRAIVAELERRADTSREWLRFATLYMLLQGTGLRISEARGLPWSAVNLDEGYLDVVQRADNAGQIGRVKSKAAIRRIPLDDTCLAWLKRWKPQAYPSQLELVFATSGGLPLNKSNLHHREWMTVCKSVGIAMQKSDGKWTTPFGFHGARHFRVSALIDSGANTKEIMDEIGHAKSSLTFDTYGHLFPDDLAKRRERANRIAESLVTQQSHEIAK